MKHRYIIYKSPSMFDINILEYVKSRICTQDEILAEIEQLNTTSKHYYYWCQLDKQYKPTEE